MAERAAVQNPMLEYANQIGWEPISRSAAMQLRGGETGLYFTDVLDAQLMKLNRGILDTGGCEEIIQRLGLLKPGLEGNRDALSWLRGEQSIFVQSDNRERNVTLIDYEVPWQQPVSGDR